MTKARVAVGVLGTALIAAALTQAPAQAAVERSTQYCSQVLGAITPSGDQVLRVNTGTTPPTASTTTFGAKDLYPDGKARLAGGLSFVSTDTGMTRHQYVVLGSDMYSVSYDVKGYGADVVPGSIEQTKVGGGWGADFRYFEESRYFYGTTLASTRTAARSSCTPSVTPTGPPP